MSYSRYRKMATPILAGSAAIPATSTPPARLPGPGSVVQYCAGHPADHSDRRSAGPPLQLLAPHTAGPAVPGRLLDHRSHQADDEDHEPHPRDRTPQRGCTRRMVDDGEVPAGVDPDAMPGDSRDEDNHRATGPDRRDG